VIEGEAGLRAEPAASGAKICFHKSWLLSGLERSDRKKTEKPRGLVAPSGAHQEQNNFMP
jgi:hypothetical protein